MERFVAIAEPQSLPQTESVRHALEVEGISVIVSYEQDGRRQGNYRVLVPEQYAERAFSIAQAGQQLTAGDSSHDPF